MLMGMTSFNSPGQRPRGVLDPGYQSLILKFVKFFKFWGGGGPRTGPSLHPSRVLPELRRNSLVRQTNVYVCMHGFF